MQGLNLTWQDLLGQSLMDLETVFAWERFVALAGGGCKSSFRLFKAGLTHFFPPFCLSVQFLLPLETCCSFGRSRDDWIESFSCDRGWGSHACIRVLKLVQILAKVLM